MGRLFQSGFELNSITTDMEWSTVSGTASIVTSPVRSGTFAGRTNPTAGTGFFRYHPYAADQNIAGFLRPYLYVAGLPAANTTVVRFLDALNNPTAQLRLTASGTLILLTAGGTQIGSASPALSVGTQYRLELGCNATTATGTLAARVDGTQFAAGNNSIQGSWSRFLVGPVVSATCDLIWDDVALNDDSGSVQNSWPGPGRVIHLVPSGTGDANGWSNTANGAGSSTNWQLVDDVPPNDATDVVQAGVAATSDLWRLTASGIGASDTVNAVQVGVRLRNNVADATTAAKAQIIKTSGGTVAQGSAIVPNSATFATNAPAQPRTPTLVTYADPDGAAWTQSTLDTMQAGVQLTTAGTNRIQVSALWVSVDYTPSAAPPAQPAPPPLVSQYTGFF
jgi:hypothetical protein